MNPGTHIAAFITGHSFPDCSGLSREQLDFQRRSGIPPEHWLEYNFPYRQTYPYPERFSVLSASIHNVAHFLRSRRPAFKQRYRDAVAEILSPYEAVILLAGSCGLELLINLDLPAEIRRRLHVFAYGPVSLRRPETASLFIVQGKYDFISRFFHREAHQRIRCFHMGYLLAPETLRLFQDFCRHVLPREDAAA